MENMCAVFVDVDAFDLFAVDVACNMASFVDDQNFFASFVCFMGKDRAEKTCSDH